MITGYDVKAYPETTTSSPAMTIPTPDEIAKDFWRLKRNMDQVAGDIMAEEVKLRREYGLSLNSFIKKSEMGAVEK